MKHSYKIVSAMLAFAVGCGGGSKNENVVDLEAAQADAPAVQQQPQRGAAFLDQGEDATKLWFEQLPEDITSSMLRESIAETFQKAPIERLDSRTVLRHAAGQRIRTNVAIPLDLEYDPRVPAHYKADDFSLDFGGWYGHAPKDPYRDLLLKSKGKLRCEANFASLRASYRVSGQRFAPVASAFDEWQCSDLMLLPDQIGGAVGVKDPALQPRYDSQCNQLLKRHVAGLVVRHCGQVKRSATRAPYQRTFVLGPFRAEAGTSFLGAMAAKQVDFNKHLGAHRRALQDGFDQLENEFGKAEYAYEQLYKSLPVTSEGRQMMAQHFAISTFALATAGLELPLWKDLLIGGGVFAVIGAATEILGEHHYLEAAGEWLGFSATLSLVDRKMNEHVSNSVKARAQVTGQTATLSPQATHVISGLAYIIASLVVDYFKGELNKGRYVHDITIGEDVAERITMAAIAVGTYVLSARFGPLGGILRSELTMLYYEVHALGRYGYFMGQAKKQEKLWGDYVSARHFAGVNDYEVILAAYGQYLKHLATASSPSMFDAAITK